MSKRLHKTGLAIVGSQSRDQETLEGRLFGPVLIQIADLGIYTASRRFGALVFELSQLLSVLS